MLSQLPVIYFYCRCKMLGRVQVAGKIFILNSNNFSSAGYKTKYYFVAHRGAKKKQSLLWVNDKEVSFKLS